MDSQVVPFDWKSCEIVDFRVMTEDWQTLKLSDGSVLKARLVLTVVCRSTNQFNPMTGEPLYWWNTLKPTRLVSYPPEYRGDPTTTRITPALIAQNINENVDYETIGKQNEWSVYSLSDKSIMRLRLNITGVARTTFHAPTGEPFYSFMTGPDNYNIKVASDLIQKRQASASTVSKETKSHAYA
jgi:hypothetical protein